MSLVVPSAEGVLVLSVVPVVEAPASPASPSVVAVVSPVEPPSPVDSVDPPAAPASPPVDSVTGDVESVEVGEVESVDAGALDVDAGGSLFEPRRVPTNLNVPNTMPKNSRPIKRYSTVLPRPADPDTETCEAESSSPQSNPRGAAVAYA